MARRSDLLETGCRRERQPFLSSGFRALAAVSLLAGLLVVLPAETARAANCDGLPVDGGAITAGNYTMTDNCVISATLEVKTGTVTINGDGHTIDGGGDKRVFLVQSDATLNLHDITVTGGGNSGFGGGAFLFGALSVSDSTFIGNDGDSGGAIYVHFFGNATVAGSSLLGNSAGVGGAIFNGGSLTVDHSIISGNSSTGSGGGIHSEGTLSVSRSTLSNNTAVLGGGLNASTGSAIVSRSTFSDNSVSGSISSAGGGIRSGSTLSVVNSTFFGNSSTRFGGGISNVGTLALTNSTLVGNAALTSAGAGIHNGGTVDVSNTIVADNPSGGNCANTGTFDALASLADDATCAGLTQVDLGALALGVLEGSPAYFPLQEGSVAIDAGDDEVCPTIDQPGNFRPQGGACDVGSYESPFSSNQAPFADAGGPYEVGEGSSVELTGAGTDPDGDPLTYAWDLDNNGIFETFGQIVSFSAAGHDGPDTQTVVLQVCDALACATDSATVEILNVAPTITEFTATADPVQVGTPITSTGSFTDPGVKDTHTATIDWGDGSTPDELTNVASPVSAAHTYDLPGVYTLTLMVTDDDGGVDSAVFEFVVVYDPDGGFVTGGGWIQSPEGAYTAGPAMTGKASFGFVSKYQKGATVPTGQTEFQFKAGGIDFHSTEYQWLVVSGAKAQYKGSGTINGEGDYGFLLTAHDGQAAGGGGVDRFRIKIWDKTTDEVVYDNQPGEADDSDASTALGGGSIVLHKG